MVDAVPILIQLLDALQHARLEVVLIGNSAAALQGAPVTTEDFDFAFRPTESNHAKIRAFAKRLGTTPFIPGYPLSRVIHVSSPLGAEVDFVPRVIGISSYEGLRSRADRFRVVGRPILVASLTDIIRSKSAAGRPKDFAVLPTLEMTLNEQKKLQRSPLHRRVQPTKRRSRRT